MISTTISKCEICGKPGYIVMQYNDKATITMCKGCAITAAINTTHKVMVFMVYYVGKCRKIDPGCHYGSEFGDCCIERMEKYIWLRSFTEWVKDNRR